jgi:hypothetical protein
MFLSLRPKLYVTHFLEINTQPLHRAGTELHRIAVFQRTELSHFRGWREWVGRQRVPPLTREFRLAMLTQTEMFREEPGEPKGNKQHCPFLPGPEAKRSGN